MPLGQIKSTKVVTEDGTLYHLDNKQGGGTEADVHKLDKNFAAKIYNDVERAISLQEKIKILINIKKNNDLPENIAAPLGFIYSFDNRSTPLGFKMQLIENHNPISLFQWSSNYTKKEEELLDQTIANFLFDLSDSLKILHSNRIFLGDLKLANILISNNRAFIIDFDSCSLSDYQSESMYTLEYVDPTLRGNDPNAQGPFQFSAESDWWALAVVAYYLFMGVSPWSGVHPIYKNTKTRSFHYSVAGLDEDVKTPKLMRPISWLDQKPKLKNYFTNIFSPDRSKRFSIKSVLELYFAATPYQQRKDNPKLMELFNSLLAYQQEFLFNVIKELQFINAQKGNIKREEERLKFIAELLGK